MPNLPADKQEKMYECVIRIDEKLTTIIERGCEIGHAMNENTKKELNKKINSLEKLMKYVAAFGVIAGIIIAYYFKNY